MVDQRRQKRLVFDPSHRPERPAAILDNFPDFYRKLNSNSRIQAASGAGQFSPAGNHAFARPSLKSTHRNHCFFEGADIPTNDGLQLKDNRSSRQQGIHSLLGYTRMAPLALDRDLEVIQSCHEWSWLDSDAAG